MSTARTHKQRSRLSVLRAGVPSTASRPAVQHGTRGRMWLGWRWVSGGLVLACAAALGVLFFQDTFYVHQVRVTGQRYLSIQDVFRAAGVADLHLFWVDPAAAREALMRLPVVAEAQVRVDFPPTGVQIVLQEREPSLVLQQGDVTMWVDLQGRMMQVREDRADLVTIVVDEPLFDVRAEGVGLPPDVVNGALQLQQLVPGAASVLRYQQANGLGFQDPQGWMAWFGTGLDMPDKLLVYQALVDGLVAQGVVPSEVSVTQPDVVHYARAR